MVTLDIVKRTGQNIIETAEAVKAAIAEMEPIFPPTTVVKITSDQSKDIRMMVSSLENNVISGLLLIVGVLFFFLGVQDLDLRGVLHPHLHVPLLPGPGRAGREHEHDRALLPDPGPGDAGGQRHRHRGEHLPVPGGGMGPGHGVQEGHR